MTRSLGLQAAGNRLVTASGAVVVLHGVDMSGTESACAQNWTHDPFGGQPEDDRATFAAMRSWGINSVRIPLNEDCWLGINGVEIGGIAYRQPVINLVHDLVASGFYVIVDLHWSAPGTQRALAQNPAPDEDHSPAFWTSVASTFKSYSKVVFDLFNEPYFYWIAPHGPDAWTCLMRGCSMTEYVTGGRPYTVEAPWQTAGMDQLLADVRATGATNLVLVAGVNWARDLSGWLAHRPGDRNVAVSWHSYPSSGSPALTECSTLSCWETVVRPLAATVPIVVTETGDSSLEPVRYLPSFLPWADAHGIGYLAWTWNAWKNPDDVLVTSMTTGSPTTGEGAYYLRHLTGSG